MTFQELFPIQYLSSEQWQAAFPLLIVSIGAVVALLASATANAGRAIAYGTVIGTTLLGLFGLVFLNSSATVTILDGVLVFDRSSQIFSFLILSAGLASCLSSLGFDLRERLHAEYFSLLAFAMVGMLGLVSTRNFVFLFIALELMSLAVYILVSMRRDSSEAAEGGLKYFILGGAASSVYLYGASLIYGSTGSLEFGGLHQMYSQVWQGQLPALAGLGLILMGVGVLFKLGTVPFHMWLPDVYTGATTPVTGFMISAVKVAAVGVLLRMGTEIYAGSEALGKDGAIQAILTVLTALTLILGSFAGLQQTQLKRLLAYSTIAHTGYLLLGFKALAAGQNVADAIVAYSLIYVISNLGAFAVLTLVSPTREDNTSLRDLAGLGKRRPFLAFALTVFLLSMAGLPPTAGFFGKYYLFLSSLSAGQVGLTLLAVVASLISAAFYLKPVVAMYMQESDEQAREISHPLWLGSLAVVGVSLGLTVALGLFPGLVSHLMSR